jgi:hypothetical protein
MIFVLSVLSEVEVASFLEHETAKAAKTTAVKKFFINE